MNERSQNMSPIDIGFDDLNAVVLIADVFGDIIYTNQAVKTIYGLDPEDVLGNGWWELTSKNKKEAAKRKKVMALLAQEKKDLGPYNLLTRPFQKSNGEVIWTQWTNTLISDNRILGLGQDVTEKKELEDALIQKNKEADLLLQEVYHRVNNNLQVILSLLHLEFENVSDQDALDALLKSQNRIHAMASLHKALYESNEIAHVDFLTYIKKLISHVVSSYANHFNVEINTVYNCKELNTKKAINIGLILTELVTNSLKHAFKKEKSPRIDVHLYTDQQQNHCLVVHDNGAGMPEDFDPQNGNTLGFEILGSLVEEIDGELHVESSRGTKTTIIFS
jgi:PAS domain S-box-containing protein